MREPWFDDEPGLLFFVSVPVAELMKQGRRKGKRIEKDRVEIGIHREHVSYVPQASHEKYVEYGYNSSCLELRIR